MSDSKSLFGESPQNQSLNIQNDIDHTEEEENNNERTTISTKKPLQKKRKWEDRSKSKEDCILDQAASYLVSRQNKVIDAEEVFGQTVAHGLCAITNNYAHEYAKVKIQEILFQAQFGMQTSGFYQRNQN